MAKKTVTPATGPRKGAGSVSTRDVERFEALFPGFSKAYGQSDFTKLVVEESGKRKPKSYTERGHAVRELFAAHLAGVGPGLGIVPLRDDDTVRFGVIDYDHVHMDHARAEAACRRLNLPLVLCRSKSGGGHFYCFTSAPVPAGLMQDKLDQWKALLGMSRGTEIFPKQRARFNDNDIGNWINLPYYGLGEVYHQKAVINGEQAPLRAFLDLAEQLVVDPSVFEEDQSGGDEGLFQGGPPCLQVIYGQGGFVEGTRNDGLMAVIVYLKKRFPDSWADKVDEYNAAMAGLGSRELVQLVKSNERKDYTYACKKAPIVDFCQRRECRKREYGISDGDDDTKGVQISALTRYDNPHGDEPMWRMEVNGKPIMVSNSVFYSRDEFNRAVMAQANLIPVQMTPQKWLRYLGELIQTADVVVVPEDASPTGQLWQFIENFTLQQANAVTKEEVWLGKPFREGGKVYFRSNDLFRYLQARKAPVKSEQAVWQLLRTKGAEKEEWHIKGKFSNIWVLPIAGDFEDDDTPAVTFEQDDEF